VVSIEVDFEVFKELTNRRATESVTYNDVIRAALNLSSRPAPAVQTGKVPKGVSFKGVFFPDGTQFRATYKGRTYTAEIKGGSWVASDGTARKSPSEAAVKVTGKNWNGWLFWHCKRPGDAAWLLINNLRDDKILGSL
jgi:hypothetical protein